MENRPCFFFEAGLLSLLSPGTGHLQTLGGRGQDFAADYPFSNRVRTFQELSGSICSDPPGYEPGRNLAC